MEQGQEKNEVLQDILLLYELSLSIGQTLDLQASCQQFLGTLMARQRIEYAGVWIRKSYLDFESESRDFQLAFAYPQSKAIAQELPASFTLAIPKAGVGSLYQSTDEGFAQLKQERGINGGQYLLIPLGDLGFLKLYSSQPSKLFDPSFRKKLSSVFSKFRYATEGCLYHARSRQETKALSQVKATLEKSEERFRNLVETAGEIIYKCDLTGAFTYVNPTAVSIMGYPEDELLGSSYLTLVHPDFRDEVQAFYQQQLAEARPRSYKEIRVVTSQGEQRCLAQNVQIDMEDGQMIGISAYARDISEQKRMQQSMLRSEAKFRQIISTAIDAVILMDGQGIITGWNPRAVEIFGWTEEEAVGTPLRDTIIPQQYREAHSQGMRHYMQGGPGPVINNQIEITALRKSGEEFPVELYITHLDLDGEALFGAFIRDITERKRIEQEIIEARETAESSAKAKETFLANMSHEIRTPMNAIVGLSELLSKTKLNAKQRRLAEGILGSADNLLVIINDILDFSKIEAGKLNLDPTAFDLRQRLSLLMESIAFRAEEKGLQLDYELDKGIAQYLSADPVRLGQVLLNLLSNAIKFTEQGSVTLGLKLLATEAGKQRIHFEVADTGIGIAPEKQEAIFSAFSQEDTSTARKYGGTGLGLAITRQLVELMGGALGVESEKGKGSVFSFTLELPMAEKPGDLGRKDEFEGIPDLSGKKLLVVEDNQMNRFLAETILKEAGAELAMATQGQEALDWLKEHRCDLILMDIQMPVMGGVEATRQIREEMKLTLPIIALTANALTGDAERYLQQGMDAYLSKPFNANELLNVIGQQLGVAGQREIINTAEERRTQESARYYSLDKLLENCRGDKGFALKMKKLFEEDTAKALADMNEHYVKQELSELGKLAHSIKPSLSIMGIDALQEDIKTLEEAVQLDRAELKQLMAKLNQILGPTLEQLANDKSLG